LFTFTTRYLPKRTYKPVKLNAAEPQGAHNQQ
jgi:hypothetical protein